MRLLFARAGRQVGVRSMSSSSWQDLSHVKKVGIIGGGVAGLQMARSLAAAGIDCKIFDRAPGPGGLWRENYAGYGLQIMKQLFEFPDYHNSVPRGTYCDGAAVQKYVEGFTDHFGLRKYVNTQTEVKSMSPRADGRRGWTFKIKDLKNGQESSEEFDFAVVATGMYSAVPAMPNLPGRSGYEAAGGKVLHSSQFLSVDAAKDKKVVVVGGGKSAIDIACISSDVAQKSTMLYRHAHWGVPRKIAGLIPFHLVFASRFGQGLVILFKGSLPKVAPVLGSVHKVIGPIMRGVFAIVEALFSVQLNQKGDYKPKNDIATDLYYAAHILDGDFKKRRASGKVSAVKGEIAELVAGGAKLTDGSKLECDLVVCATGFDKTYDYLPKETKDELSIQSDGLWLYRHILHPNVKDLAFCGSEIATLINLTTHGMQAEWIARALTGQVKLPAEAEMKDEIEANQRWKRSWMLPSRSRANMILLHHVHYHQSLLQDMGENTRRFGGISEYLRAYECAAFDGIVGKARKAAAA